MAKIYLDHAATTPLHPKVLETLTQSLREDFGNPSSIHQFGRQVQGKLEQVRQQVATSLGAKESEIVFTSGGTEGNNTVIMQTARSRQATGKHIITTAVEHPAVLETMAFLAREGFEITYLPVNTQGEISLVDFQAALRPDTILVSIMYTNNELGVRYPIAEIGEILAEHSAYFHTDAVQAYGLETLQVSQLGIDFLTATAHKINGPKGLGILYIREGTTFEPLFHGGEQELKRRPGTENLPSIVGLGEALTQLTIEEKRQRQAKYQAFGDLILTRLKDAGVEVVLNGGQANKSSHILNLWLKGVPNDLVLMHLDLQGFAISIGSACTAGNVNPSHVLEAMYGKGHPSTKESVRLSFGLGNTKEEVEEFAAALIKVIGQLKK